MKNLLNRDINSIPEIFRTSINSLRKYLKYTCNALKYDFSNARVEGNNNLIKAIKRVSFGYKSYENFKLRILLIKNANKNRTPKNKVFDVAA